jgi:uncharacterized protein (DUF488 family)
VTDGKPLLTVGHGTLTADELSRVVRGAGVELLVDVRSFPGSRRHPQFGRDAMARWLPDDAGIAYEWEPGLGGRRRTSPQSRNTALTHPAFRGYADYMATPEFATALDRLMDEKDGRRTTVMCAESVWWRCHRRLLADAVVLLRDTPVVHLFHDGRLQPHRPTPEARVEDGVVVYDAGEPPLPGLTTT